MVERNNYEDQLLPMPPQALPLLVFPCSGEPTFYDFVHQTSVKQSISWLHNSVCRASAFGWLLLQDLDSLELSLFHPITTQLFSLPKVEIEINENFICRFSCPPDDLDCHLIAIHKTECYYLCCQSGLTEWMMYRLEVEDESRKDHFQDAVVYNGKIYAWSVFHKFLVIDPLSCDPLSYLEAELNDPYSRYDAEDNLVESCGDLYLVKRNYYDENHSTSLCRTFTVYKMSFSSYSWRAVKSIENRVFTLGNYYSMSFSACNEGVKGDVIYFGDWNGVFYSFGLESRGLTIEFSCRDVLNDWAPYWLLLDRPPIMQAGSFQEIEEDRSGGGLPNLKDIRRFDRPLSFLPFSIRVPYMIRGAAPLTWSPRIPWLMFTDGYDDIFRFLDPYSNKFYELHIPELSENAILSSKDGWLLSLENSIFFFNPFTKERVDLPIHNICFIDSVACSSAPTSADCLVFIIFNSEDGNVMIDLFSFRDNSWTCKVYANNFPLGPSKNCPVYLNGLFCCLGLDGTLGIYDPTADTWNVLDTVLSFDVPISKCFLVVSNNELLSVFFDLYENPVGVFVMNFCLNRWEKVTHLGNRTLFVGMEASFSVTTVEKRMANKIYLPKFCGEYNRDLVVHHVGMENIDQTCKTTEYVHVWIEPKDVAFGLNQMTGKIYASCNLCSD